MFLRFMRGSRNAAATAFNGRKACEKRLLDLMDEAYKVFKECYPDACHLSLFSSDDGCCAMGYIENDGIRVSVIDGFKGPNGWYKFTDVCNIGKAAGDDA